MAALALSVLAPACSNGSKPVFRGFESENVREGQSKVVLTFPSDKPVVINFFGNWCEPCKKEMPLLASAAKAHAGVRFIGADTKDSRSGATELLDASGTPYEAAYDPSGSLADANNVRGFPSTFFIGRDGKVVERVQGQLQAGRLESLLTRLEAAA